jgi:hypothetical protein
MQGIRHVLTKMVLKNCSALLRIQSFRYARELEARSTWIPVKSAFIYIKRYLKLQFSSTWLIHDMSSVQ